MENNIVIIGSGTRGSGIAQVAATAGEKVTLFDNNPEALKRSEDKLKQVLNRLVEKKRITKEEKERIISNIEYVNEWSEIRDSKYYIEAIIEDGETKKELFKNLEGQIGEESIIASNTSSLSMTGLASSLKNPKRFIGLHFFNPPPLMPLVEVIPAVQTSEEVKHQSMDLMKKWNKTVVLAKDTPGFIVNRIARPFYGEALRIHEEGFASFREIDHAMRNIGGFRMGPFELMDFIGNDVNYAVTKTVFEEFYYDPRYKPSFIQKRMIEAGYLGKKTGKGYYDYDKQGGKMEAASTRIEYKKAKMICDRILVMLINEAADALFFNIASAEDIELAMTQGVNYPKGLLEWANEKSMEWCVKSMDALYDEYHEERYRCSPLLRKLNNRKKKFELNTD